MHSVRDSFASVRFGSEPWPKRYLSRGKIVMSLGIRANLILAVGLLLALCSAGKAWSQSCCDESSTECRSGQKPGDKGSCTGSEVCVLFASECPKKKEPPRCVL